jgi:ATP-binding cassette, subfamily B (MDR/TAP), member 1
MYPAGEQTHVDEKGQRPTSKKANHMGHASDEPPQSNVYGDSKDRLGTAGWSSLLAFTTSAHVLPLVLGLLLSAAAGVIEPATAILLGRLFDSFSGFGAGTLTASDLTDNISMYAIYLLALGSASWLLQGGYFMFWLAFGELQAKSVRDRLFDGMLQKDMAWFDTQKGGFEGIFPRLQSYVYSS